MLVVLIASLTVAALLLGLTQRFGCSWSGDGATNVSSTGSQTGDAGSVSEFTLGTGTVTNQEQVLGFETANVKGVLIEVADNPATTVVLKTNSSGSPTNTFTFPAGGGVLFWRADFPSEVANPFGTSTDVTTTFWTKSGVDTPSVSWRVFYNG